jgi:hypothetical protein
MLRFLQINHASQVHLALSHLHAHESKPFLDHIAATQNNLRLVLPQQRSSSSTPGIKHQDACALDNGNAKKTISTILDEA